MAASPNPARAPAAALPGAAARERRSPPARPFSRQFPLVRPHILLIASLLPFRPGRLRLPTADRTARTLFGWRSLRVVARWSTLPPPGGDVATWDSRGGARVRKDDDLLTAGDDRRALWHAGDSARPQRQSE